jgi:hypothetical protein
MRKNEKKEWFFNFESTQGFYDRKEKCFTCGGRFPTPYVAPELTYEGPKGWVINSSWHLCPKCVLSDIKALAATARARAAKERRRFERTLESLPEAEREDYRDYTNDSAHEELEEIAEALDGLPGMDSLGNYALTAHVARFYVGEARKGAA